MSVTIGDYILTDVFITVLKPNDEALEKKTTIQPQNNGGNALIKNYF